MKKKHSRIGRLHQNCITLNQYGALEKGLACVDGNVRFIPHFCLEQQFSRRKKGLMTDGLYLSDTERSDKRIYNACYVRKGPTSVLCDEGKDACILHLTSNLVLPFGDPYTGDPFEMVVGGVLMHPTNRYRDGHFVLGEAWEDAKTSLMRISRGHQVMVGERYMKDGQWFTRVVTIKLSAQFLIMRHPSGSEMQWFAQTMKEIRAEEHSARMRADPLYRSLMEA